MCSHYLINRRYYNTNCLELEPYLQRLKKLKEAWRRKVTGEREGFPLCRQAYFLEKGNPNHRSQHHANTYKIR
jgi:hypothetical protein